MSAGRKAVRGTTYNKAPIAILSGAIAFIAGSVLIFGGPLRGLMFVVFWHERLGLPYWPYLVVAAIALASLMTWAAQKLGIARALAPAVFITAAMALPAVFVASAAEPHRARVMADFAPDKEFRSSIFMSFRNAPQEFQFFLQGAAIKDCTPYAWSYRTMDFYQLPPNVAVNVLPVDWIKECQLRRVP